MTSPVIVRANSAIEIATGGLLLIAPSPVVEVLVGPASVTTDLVGPVLGGPCFPSAAVAAVAAVAAHGALAAGLRLRWKEMGESAE